VIDKQRAATRTNGRPKRTRAAEQPDAGRRLAVLVGLTLSFFALGDTPRAATKEALVPPGIQAALTLRILEYDRALKSWAGPALVVGVVAKGTAAGEGELRQGLVGRSAQGIPLQVTAHAFRDVEGLKGWIDKSGVRFLYVSADLGADASAVMSVAAARRLPALASMREQFENGGALGIVVREGKPHILVNLGAARAAGMDLDPKLLQLAEVVR